MFPKENSETSLFYTTLRQIMPLEVNTFSFFVSFLSYLLFAFNKFDFVKVHFKLSFNNGHLSKTGGK